MPKKITQRKPQTCEGGRVLGAELAGNEVSEVAADLRRELTEGDQVQAQTARSDTRPCYAFVSASQGPVASGCGRGGFGAGCLGGLVVVLLYPFRAFGFWIDAPYSKCLGHWPALVVTPRGPAPPPAPSSACASHPLGCDSGVAHRSALGPRRDLASENSVWP